jgi:hypothetical protein
MKKLIVAIAWLAVLGVWIGILGYKAVADPTLKEWTIAVPGGADAGGGVLDHRGGPWNHAI